MRSKYPEMLIWNGETLEALPTEEALKRIKGGIAQDPLSCGPNDLKPKSELQPKPKRGRPPKDKSVKSGEYSRADMRAAD